MTTATTYYCQLCGHEMKYEGQFYLVKLNRHADQLLCNNSACKLHRATVLDCSLEDGSFAKAWRYTPKFDIRTGEAAQEGIYV